jgi:hypothetical protein
MRPLEIIAYLGLTVGLVILYQIFRLLERILDLLLRSLPLHAVALLPPENESVDVTEETQSSIQGFRQKTSGSPDAVTANHTESNS